MLDMSAMFPGHEASASDRQIVQRNNLTQVVDQSDSLMGDEGFDVQYMAEDDNKHPNCI